MNRGLAMLAFLKHQRRLLEKQGYIYEQDEEKPRVLSDEEFVEQKNKEKGNGLLRLIKRKLG